jgi:AcrR family transcriptional regulator
MPRPRFERAEPALKTAILDAAAAELAENGYDGASLNRILLAAGLSKGAFYYYFDDKADLVATVLEHELARFNLADLRPVDSAEAFWAEVSRFTRTQLEELRHEPQRSSILSRLAVALARSPELMARCGPVIAQLQDTMTAFWSTGQRLGAVRDDLPVHVLLAVAQACKTALTPLLLPVDRGATVDELEAFARIHIDMVRRLAEPASGEVKA